MTSVVHTPATLFREEDLLLSSETASLHLVVLGMDAGSAVDPGVQYLKELTCDLTLHGGLHRPYIMYPLEFLCSDCAETASLPLEVLKWIPLGFEMECSSSRSCVRRPMAAVFAYDEQISSQKGTCREFSKIQ